MKGCSKEETSWYRIIPKAHMSTFIHDGSDASGLSLSSITSGARYPTENILFMVSSVNSNLRSFDDPKSAIFSILLPFYNLIIKMF
jgi:hypothetical protein